MSLSVERPMVAEPDGVSTDLPGQWILRILVAIFDLSPLVWLGAGPTAGGCALAGRRALDYFRGTWPSPGILVHLKGQQRPDEAADIDVLTVLDVDGRHPAAVDEHPVEAVVVDGDPAAL